MPLQLLGRWQFSYYFVFQFLSPVLLEYSLKGLWSTVCETQETRQCSHCIFEKCDLCFLLSARKRSKQCLLVSKNWEIMPEKSHLIHCRCTTTSTLCYINSVSDKCLPTTTTEQKYCFRLPSIVSEVNRASILNFQTQ